MPTIRMTLVGRVGLEPTTKGFRFARVTSLPGLSHHPRRGLKMPHVRVPGARGTLIGSAPHVLVSAPSRLLTTPACGLPFGELGSGLPCPETYGFPEFTRFSSASLETASPIDESSALTN
jgi:hypothetical protein